MKKKTFKITKDTFKDVEFHVTVTPTYWIMVGGQEIIIPNQQAKLFLEVGYMKLKEGTTSNELEFTNEKLK